MEMIHDAIPVVRAALFGLALLLGGIVILLPHGTQQ